MTEKNFEKLGLNNEILEYIEKAEFKKPSEIQEKVIPLALKGKDVLAGSATGSGKTLAFSLPIIQNLKHEKHIQALVLTPTRELAEQITTTMKDFSNSKKLRVTSVYGGVDIQNQARKLPYTDIVVGTPGRIIDHIERGNLQLDKIKVLVLDEVDRMLDMGFYKDVEKIIKKCPKQRQTLFFSATIDYEIEEISKMYSENPVKVLIKSYVDPSKLKHVYYDTPGNLKFSLLVHLLKKENSEKVMVFCSTRRNVDSVATNLSSVGIKAKAIHGGFSQNQRTKTLEDFHKNKINVLVCTDVAARGLDIKEVSHVYNYDLPKTASEYIHRVGRTARAGKNGIAVNILSSRDYESFSKITEDKSLDINRVELPYFEKIKISMDKKDNFGSGKRSFSRGFSKNRGSERSFSDKRKFSDKKDSGRNYSGKRNSGRNFSNDKSSGKSFSKNRGSERSFSAKRKFSDKKDSRDNSGKGFSAKRNFSKRNDNRNKKTGSGKRY